jgi:hypothetical protein
MVPRGQPRGPTLRRRLLVGVVFFLLLGLSAGGHANRTAAARLWASR